MSLPKTIRTISVIVPASPFTPKSLSGVKHCLAALNIEQLMVWWPGLPHMPNRNADKVRAIQRSLDWRRVAQIAAYLLQREIVGAPELLNRYFRDIYEPRKLEKGREWPPSVPHVVGFERSQYPTFSNVLLHVNGAKIGKESKGTANLVFDEADPHLNFSVIDGQHRINGAFLAVKILKEADADAEWEIPAEVFLDLDDRDAPPRHQAQIFIDVNFYQKKVDRSLVADLFPTARGTRAPLDNKERAQDLGRRLMLEVGPLVGMVRIPGIRYGVKDVVSLATLNSAIEDAIPFLKSAGIVSLHDQAAFLAQCLDAWVDATCRREELEEGEGLDPDNVAYQGRVIVSFLALVPACIHRLKVASIPLIGEDARSSLTSWLHDLMKRTGFLTKGKFLAKTDFKQKGFLGSGGVARFRNTLWAGVSGKSTGGLNEEDLAELAERTRAKLTGTPYLLP